MMDKRLPEVILSFEPPAAPAGPVRLSVYPSERDYFDYAREPRAEGVWLSRLFQEALLHDEAGWRRRTWQASDAVEIGQRMWSSLPAKVRATILDPAGETTRRVAVLRGGTGMDDVPWEWLNAGPETTIAAMDRIRFVRLVPTLRAVPPLTVVPPVRVLVAITDAVGGPLFQPRIEIGVVAAGLERPVYDLRVVEESRLDALLEALAWSPHIVHYVGHGGISGSTGNLLLHDSHDGTRWVPAMEFARLLPASVRLACLSTCVSTENYEIGGLVRVAHCPPEFPLPTTIVNQYAVTDLAASAFWSEFYPRLASLEGCVLDAFHYARMSARAASPDTACWAGFSLVLRDGAERPLRFGTAGADQDERFAAELEAQWAARNANNLAIRMRTLQAGVQKHWEQTLAEEVARVESFERDSGD
jgi:hypothetical protein